MRRGHVSNYRDVVSEMEKAHCECAHHEAFATRTETGDFLRFFDRD
jgi:hypothetical protein